MPLQNRELREQLEVTASCEEQEEEEAEEVDQEQEEEQEQEQVEEGDCHNENKEVKKVDEVYGKYAERMRYFDQLNQDRAFGISGYLTKSLVHPVFYLKFKKSCT